MRGLALLSFGSTILLAGCATEATRAPVLPEPPHLLQSADCAALGRFADVPPPKINPHPYGWGRVHYDVERGVITKAEILDSSPQGLFDAETIALVKSQHYPSLGTAHGCVWFHKWG